jgi:hypothetical protein
MSSLGYDDTMYISGNPYRVHDVNRPQPRIVTPGQTCGDAPSDAAVLFDGSDLSQWMKLDGSPAAWIVENGYMEVAPKSGNIKTKQAFGDCQLHVEFASPEEVVGEGQGRGNSGIFLMEQYEIQVLDNYNNPTYADGLCGAIYGQSSPLVNACREPGAWSNYDIIWEGPVFDADRLLKPAYLTVLLNGVILHNRKALLGPTQHKVTTQYKPHAREGSLMLQDHGDKVRFRNIWIRDLTNYDQA